MNKSGIELTVNFVVVLILAVAALAVAAKITADLFTSASDAQLSPTIDAQLAAALQQQSFAVLPSSLLALRGSDAQLGIGIRNINDEAITFSLRAAVTEAADGNSKPVAYNYSRFAVTAFTEHTIAAAATKTIPVLVSIPDDAPSGTYALTAYLCDAAPCTAETAAAVKKSYIAVQ